MAAALGAWGVVGVVFRAGLLFVGAVASGVIGAKLFGRSWRPVREREERSG